MQKARLALAAHNAAVAPFFTSTDTVDVHELLAGLSDKSFFYDRRLCEGDPQLKQFLPYVVIFNRHGQILRYQRPSKGGEKRLQGDYSIGFGGHCDDVASYNGTADLEIFLDNEMHRELTEELDIFNYHSSGVRAVIYNDTLYKTLGFDDLNLHPENVNIPDTFNQVGLCHLALVNKIILDMGRFPINADPNEVQNLSWLTLQELKDSLQTTKYERWSHILIQAMT